MAKSIRRILNKRLGSILSDKDLKEIAYAGLIASDDNKDVETQRGSSPIKNSPKFTSYSPSYSKQKGRSSPVTLRNTSQSIERTQISKSKGELRFTDSQKGKIFNVHQRGASFTGAYGQQITIPKRQIFPETTKDIPEEVVDAMTQKTIELIKKNVG